MLTRVLAVSTITAAFLVPLHAQQQAQISPFQKWLNEDVFWIITDQERTGFNRLVTDDERQSFIDSFWMRRDPTPDTESNEFREEYYRRVQWANDRFSTINWPGWKSDRGMLYIRYGAPDEREEHAAGSTESYPYERWHYRVLQGIGRDIVLELVDKTKTNEYRLTWDPSDKDALLRVPGPGVTLYEQMNLIKVK
jgi:GWxTD domain-containing protein